MLPKIPSSWALSAEPITTSTQADAKNPRSDKRAKLRVVPETAPTPDEPAAVYETPSVAPIEFPTPKIDLGTQMWLSIIEILSKEETHTYVRRGARAYLKMVMRGKSGGNFKKGAILDHRAE